MKSILFNLFFLLLFVPVSATNYYLSNSGNDANNGKSPIAAWRSIDRLNASAANMQAGDSILFQRGNTFTGQIEALMSGTNGNPIVLAAYGNGTDPVISGAVRINSWTKMSGSNIWWASVPDSIAYLMVNKHFETLARYPNTGFLTIASGNKSQLTCGNLPGSYNYWKGATVRIRTTRWTYEARPVSISTNAGTLFFGNPTQYDAGKNWGFFLDNKFEELDMPGEWYYDAVAKRVYYWPKAGQNPNSLLIEGIVHDYGFIRVDGRKMENYSFHNLNFTGQKLEGVRLSNTNNRNFIIQNCKFYNQGETGIYLTGNNISLRNCYFEGQLGRGVKGHYVDGGTFRDNVMKNIGLIAGYGYDGNQNMNGFHFTRSDNLYIGYNQIDSMGYTGITCYAGYSTVEKNIINYTNLRLDDGSAIYAYSSQSHHTLIQDNIIRHVVGYPDGSKSPEKTHAFGIYMDWDVDYNIIRNNTIIGAATSAIFINTGNNNQLIEDNIMVDYGEQGIRMMETIAASTTYDNTFRRNVCYSYEADSEPVLLLSLYETEDEFAFFEENYLLNPYSDYTMRHGGYGIQYDLTQEQWDAQWPHMTNGNKLSPFQYTGYEVLGELSPNLVANGEFSGDENGWSYTQASNIQSGWVSNGGLDGGAIEMKFLNSTVNIGTVSTDLGEDLLKDHTYRLNCSLISDSFGIVEVIFITQTGALVHKELLPYSPTRRDHELVISFPADLVNGKIGFRQKKFYGQHFIVDNIELKQVDAQAESPESKVQLFTNPTNAVTNVPLNGVYFDLDGNPMGGSFSLNPYTSRLLYRGTGTVNNLPPKAIFTVDNATGFAAFTVNFDGTASTDPDGFIAAYQWHFGDGGTATSATPAYTYNTPGTYSARLIVVDNSGAADTAFQTITVNAAVNAGGCNLPPVWATQDITSGQPGEACYDINTGQYTISSSGEQLNKVWDRYHYVFQRMTGDGWIIARINRVEQASTMSMAGVMVRNSQWGNDKSVFMGITAEEAWVTGVREESNEPAELSIGSQGSAAFNSFVKIERIGNVLSCYLSEDGTNWTLMSTQNILMEGYQSNGMVLIGLASLSGDNGALSTAEIDYVSMSSNVGVSSFPVELTYFGGEVVNEKVALSWVTETELNNDFFTVERSVDGLSFESMGNVKGAGTTTRQQEYKLDDNEPFKGTAYYRLKQTDLDGTFQYLATVEINFNVKRKPKLNAYPNPVVHGRINLALEGIEPEQIERMYLMDLSGREVSVINPTAKFMNYELPQSVPSGTYVLVAVHAEGMIQKQITVL